MEIETFHFFFPEELHPTTEQERKPVIAAAAAFHHTPELNFDSEFSFFKEETPGVPIPPSQHRGVFNFFFEVEDSCESFKKKKK